MKIIAVAAGFIFTALILSAQVKEAFTGKKLPSVEVLTLDGKRVDISDYGKSGKITVISFWATWCGPCKVELNNISDIYDDWKKDYNVQMVAVSIDDSRSTAKVKSYVQAQGWDFEVLLDPNQDLKRAFNFQMPPYTVLVNKEGTIVSTHLGYKSGDEAILEDEIKELVR
ncbi:MAG TPA: TlpA disulfide reductase family protein [Chitinophagales bacterium]|nr:TlpA disulfide reductase family protein [Chitinophagales bacterium]